MISLSLADGLQCLRIVGTHGNLGHIDVAVSGSPEYFVTSKDHKYNCWTPNAGLQYYAINSKPLQRVLKPLGRIEARDSKRLDRKTTAKGAISGRKRIAKNEHDYALAVKAAEMISRATELGFKANI